MHKKKDWRIDVGYEGTEKDLNKFLLLIEKDKGTAWTHVEVIENDESEVYFGQ